MMYGIYGPDIDLNHLKSSHTTASERYDQWWRIVEDYSRRSLNYQEDKLMALQGIATVFASHCNDEYVSGLWRKDLVARLLWVNDQHGHSERIGLANVASWSCASVNCGIISRNDNMSPAVSCIEILDVSPTKLRMKGNLWQCAGHCR